MGEVKKGDIAFVDLEPVKGSEQRGIRPALIIQNDLGNKYSQTTIIALITSKIFSKEYPTNVQLSNGDGGLDRDSTVLLNQIRTIDKARIIKKIGFLDEELMKKVDLAIKVSLALD